MSERRDGTRRDGGTRRSAESKLVDLPPQLNALTDQVIGAAIEVHRTLGPGLLEKLYVQALVFELNERGLQARTEVPVSVPYKTIELSGQRLDLVVAGKLVIEAKAIERVHDVHLAQLVSYLRSGKFPVGLLINFNTPLLKDGLYRRVNTQAISLPDSSSPRSSAPSAFKSSEVPS